MTTFRRWADPVRGANQPTPILANGPEQYDFDKVGPCAVVQIGPRRLTMLYEGIDPSLDPGAPGGDLYNAVCLAEATDYATWTKRGRLTKVLSASIAANADDGYIDRAGSAFGLEDGGENVDAAGTTLIARRDYMGFGGNINYFDGEIYLRFDTSAIPDNAIILSAVLKFKVPDTGTAIANVNSRNAVFKWRDWGPTLDVNDNSVSGVTALTTALSNFAQNTAYELSLGALDQINKSGYSHLSIEVDGGQPTGGNRITLAALEHATDPPAELVVTYQTISGSGRVLTPAASPSWENSENCPSSLVWDSTNSRWVLFFHGGNNTGPRAIGFAYAPDLTNGGVWTKYASNPVLQKGGAGAWDELFVADGKVIVVNASLWIMFYVGRNAAGAGQIGRATSTDQGATWTKDAGNPVLAFGASGSWDDADIHAFSVVRVKSDLMVAYYFGRELIPGGNPQLGRAYSYDEGVTWVRDVTNPVMGDAADDDPSDSVEVLAEGTKHHIYYGQFDFVGQTLRGKGYATAALSALPRTEALDLVERADDATPPPGASWANPAAGAGTAGLVVLGRALAHNGSANYRVTSVWNQQFPGGNPEVWIEFQQVSDGNNNEGFALHICHHNPATTTDVGKGGQGWTLDVEHGVTNDLINMYPFAAGGGAWTNSSAGKHQVGDIYVFRYTPGGNVQCIRIRNGVETVLLSRAYNAAPDDLGAFPNPYQPAKDGQPFWLKMDMMRNNENRIKTFGGGSWASLPTTFHGRA